MCPYNSYIQAASVRYEDRSIDHYDETALNGLKVRCRIPQGYTFPYEPEFSGMWGEWKTW